MDNVSNGAIAAAYLIIPLTLMPLLRSTHREIWLNLVLAVAFVFSCGVGHVLTALHLHSSPWHWVTAVVSWLAVIVLLKSQSRLRYLGETFRLLDISWEQSLTGQTLWEVTGNDLTLLKINPAGNALNQNLIQPGDRLCEKMPSHRDMVYPYQESLIDLYLQTLETGTVRRMEFRYTGEVSGWYLTFVTPLAPKLLHITFSNRPPKLLSGKPNATAAQIVLSIAFVHGTLP
jgi:hypothetical protein